MATEQPEITVSLQDMETHLESEEYQRFLKAKEEIDQYREKLAEYDGKKAEAERLRDECRKKRDEAKSDDERRFWDAEEIKHRREASRLSSPYYSVYYIGEHDRLLGLVRERKVEEERRKEKEKKRRDALECIDPPVDDAKRYLSDQEYQQFRGSLLGAADAYIGGGKGCLLNDWRLDRRAHDYESLTYIIKERKAKVDRRKRAEVERDRFIKEVHQAAQKLKQQLSKGKKPAFPYSPAANYSPGNWFDSLHQPTDSQIKAWVAPQVSQGLPKCLRGLVSWDIDWEMAVVPYAQYENPGLSCLVWVYRTFIVVTVQLRLLEGKVARSFEGYHYEVEIHNQNLGSLYLGPEEPDHWEGFSTPLALLALLTKGEYEGDGIKAARVDGSTTSFVVRGYHKDSIEVDHGFREFIMEAGKDDLAEALLKMGLIDDTTAHLVKAHWGEPLPASPATEHWGSSGLELVVAKLVELGWAEDKALEAAESVGFPHGATVDDTVKYLIQNSYAKP